MKGEGKYLGYKTYSKYDYQMTIQIKELYTKLSLDIAFYLYQQINSDKSTMQ